MSGFALESWRLNGWSRSLQCWCPRNRLPIKTLDIKAGELAWLRTFLMYCHTSLLEGEVSVSLWDSTGQGQLGAWPWFLDFATMCPYSFLSFKAYLLALFMCCMYLERRDRGQRSTFEIPFSITLGLVVLFCLLFEAGQGLSLSLNLESQHPLVSTAQY